ncbi:MAG: permease of phosphate ABC transporter [Clostridiales bacterium]|nr:permease of phosphate ABC transporter [Clostridiales bacterium]
MKCLLNYADRYMEKADWKDMELIKICLCSMGILIGTSVSNKAKGSVKKSAKILFVLTYIPLMIKAAVVFLEGKPARR